ncbi:MAG: hypothetical protein ACP5NA_00240 [Candidatus Acidulodesulfobacterium sp.]
MKSKIKIFFVILFAFFLFIVILSLLNRFKAGNNKKLNILHKTPYRNKEINKLDLSVKVKDGRPKAESTQLSRKPLRDIFNIPHKKYEKYSRLFIPHSKSQKNATAGYAAKSAPDLMNQNRSFYNGGNLSNIVKNLKFKGFSDKNKRAVALIFTGGNTALIKINGKKHYVHTGENIGGVFILKIEPSKIIYSSKGKILYKYLKD